MGGHAQDASCRCVAAIFSFGYSFEEIDISFHVAFVEFYSSISILVIFDINSTIAILLLGPHPKMILSN